VFTPKIRRFSRHRQTRRNSCQRFLVSQDFRGQYTYLILMMSVHPMARVARVVAPVFRITSRNVAIVASRYFSRTRTSRSTSTSWRPRAKAAGRRFGPIADA
jgi:hypothetical protein